MRRWIVILLVVIVPALLAASGYYWFACGQSSHATTGGTAGGYDAQSGPATLEEVLAIARQARDEIEREVHDYSAVIVKQERVGNDLIDRDLTDEDLITTVMFAKLREKPFSVYLYFLDRSNDKNVKGREVIYAQGRNDNNLLVHTPGFFVSRTLSLDPAGWLAMNGEHYPITEIGLANLCRQLINRGESAGDSSRVAVKRYPRARINTRACTLLEITYPVNEPKKKHWGYLARVFLDNQWHFPIRVEVYELPLDRKLKPQLVEGYTYLDVKLNNGYSDADFDPKNPQYKYP